MAHKICPKCQSPAPLEATFCGQCGRQYRTKFGAAPNTQYPSPLDSLGAGSNLSHGEERDHSAGISNCKAPSPNLSQTLVPRWERDNARSAGSRAISASIVVMAAVVAVLILLLANRSRTGDYSVQTARS